MGAITFVLFMLFSSVVFAQGKSEVLPNANRAPGKYEGTPIDVIGAQKARGIQLAATRWAGGASAILTVEVSYDNGKTRQRVCRARINGGIGLDKDSNPAPQSRLSCAGKAFADAPSRKVFVSMEIIGGSVESGVELTTQ